MFVFDDFTIKYIGTINASDRNPQNLQIFGPNSKAYNFLFLNTKDRYEFDFYDSNIEYNHETSTPYTSFDEFISTQNNGRWFEDVSADDREGISFSSDYQSGDTSGTLVLYSEDQQSIIDDNAGSWEIKTVNVKGENREVLVITPKEEYQEHSDFDIFTVKDGKLYRGWYEKAGATSSFTLFDQQAYDEMIEFLRSNGISDDKLPNTSKDTLFGTDWEVVKKDERYIKECLWRVGYRVYGSRTGSGFTGSHTGPRRTKSESRDSKICGLSRRGSSAACGPHENAKTGALCRNFRRGGAFFTQHVCRSAYLANASVFAPHAWTSHCPQASP
jgi:hypothetical protein